MKHTKYHIAIIISIVWSYISIAQEFTTPLDYLNYISQQQEYLMQKSWDYTHTVAHSKSISKIDKGQKELIRAVEKSLSKIKKMPAFANNSELRDAVVTYLEGNLSVYKNEYQKMIDLKEVTLTSYNALENYLQIRELANKKLDTNLETYRQAQQHFADAFGITLMNVETDLSKKIDKANEVIDYQDQLYLIFFKSLIAEDKLIESFAHEDAALIEKNNEELKKAITEGRKKLIDYPNFEGDNTLTQTVAAIFSFYEEETNTHIPELLNYYQAKEKFEAMDTAIKEMPQSQRTAKVIDAYNKSVKEMNKEVKGFNKTQQKLNTLRSKTLLGWNANTLTFFDHHIPKES